MSDALKKEVRYTYADYCSWPEGERWELIDGVAYAMAPAPSQTHQTVFGVIFTQLHNYLKGKPCKVFSAPFDVRLNVNSADDTVVQPDILVVCDESKLDGKGVVGAPNLVIEILSPSSMRHDFITKKMLYQRAGVREYWIVDPESKTVTANVLRSGRYMSLLYDDQDAAVPVEVLEGFAINLTEVFEGL